MVEDDPGDIELVHLAAREAEVKFNFDVVRDGQQALHYLHGGGAYASAHDPDMILLNLNLPGKSGSEILGDIRGDQRLKCIPLVIWSSSAVQHELLALYGLSERCFFTKPIRFRDIAHSLKTMENWFRANGRRP
jgi:two-component system response regulator